MRERFAHVITGATGRDVIGFMSGNQQNPDIMCEVFILAPTDLVDDTDPLGDPPAPTATPVAWRTGMRMGPESLGTS